MMPARALQVFRHPVLAGLAAVAGASIGAACGGGGGPGDDIAGRIVREETAGSCIATKPAPGTVTPDGQELLKGVSTLTAQPSPEAAEGSAGSALSREVTSAARNFVNCWNQRRFDEVLGLITVDFMKSFLVLENPADARIVLEGLPGLSYTVRSLGDVKLHRDGRASIAVEYTAVHQQKVARWYFVKREGQWLLDQEDRLRFDPGLETSSAAIDMKDFAYQPASTTVKANPVVRLDVTNSGALPHEVVLVKVAPGIDPTTLLQPGVQPEGVEFFGQTMAVPGQKQEIVMTGLAPGQYVMVCQLRFPKGPLHSAQGMVGLLIVE